MPIESSTLTGVLFEGVSVDFKSRFTDRARVVEEREFFVQIALDFLLTPPLGVGDVFLLLPFCPLVDWALFLAIFWYNLADALYYLPDNKAAIFAGFLCFLWNTADQSVAGCVTGVPWNELEELNYKYFSEKFTNTVKPKP